MSSHEERELRLQRYVQLTRDDPSSLHEDADVGSYIAINPLADERELLVRLGVEAASCTKVDCYWRYDDDVYFLQVQTKEQTTRPEGLWSRCAQGEPPHVNLVAVVSNSLVTRSALHEVMRRFVQLGLRNLPLLADLRRVDDGE